MKAEALLNDRQTEYWRSSVRSPGLAVTHRSNRRSGYQRPELSSSRLVGVTALLGVQFIGSLQAKQRFETGDNSDGKRNGVYLRVVPLTEIGESELTEESRLANPQPGSQRVVPALRLNSFHSAEYSTYSNRYRLLPLLRGPWITLKGSANFFINGRSHKDQRLPMDTKGDYYTAPGANEIPAY